jgi:hypothetical protein
VIDVDATLVQQFFEVSVGAPVAQVPANRNRDHIRREAEPREAGPRCDTRRGRRRINQACLISFSTDPTVPDRQPVALQVRGAPEPASYRGRSRTKVAAAESLTPSAIRVSLSRVLRAVLRARPAPDRPA